MIRKPVFNGSFYLASADALKNVVKQYFNEIRCEKKYNDVLGIISPHAGYVYSGKCAAHGYASLRETNFEKVVIIAPSHRWGNFQFSVGKFSHYKTPLGLIDVDQDTVEQLLKKEGFTFEPEAHKTEHSLEVQLPLLQYINPKVKIIPILFGRQDFQSSKYLAEVLYKVFKGDFNKTKIIISTDLSHYHSSEIAENMDGKLIENIKNFQIEEIIKGIQAGKIEACGIGGILTIIYLAEMLEFSKMDILKYTHSGFTSGDNVQVVGYLSSLFYK